MHWLPSYSPIAPLPFFIENPRTTASAPTLRLASSGSGRGQGRAETLQTIRTAKSDNCFPSGFGPAVSNVLAGEPEQRLENALLQWKMSAPREEARARTIASDRFRAAFHGKHTTLDLERLGLTSLPESFFELPALETVNIAHNRLRTFPAMADSVRAIYANNNSLDHLSQLHAGLRILDVSNNSLVELMAIPASTTHLWAANNRIRHLGTLSRHLRELHVGGNQISEMPALSAGLEMLIADGNPFYEVPVLPATMRYLRLDQGAVDRKIAELEKLITVGTGDPDLVQSPTRRVLAEIVHLRVQLTILKRNT